MDGYTSDDEQWEKLKGWWKANATFVIVGLAIGLAIIGGWRWWHHYRAERELSASVLYSQFEQALATTAADAKADDAGKAEAIGKNLISNYSDTPYAAQAALGLAGAEVAAAKPAPAGKHLQWVVDHSSDRSLKLLARLRLARVQIADHQAKTALATLAGVEPGGYAPLYAEVRGDAYQAMGDTAKAHEAYQQALAGHTDDMGDDSLLKMKLRHTALPTTAARS